MTKRLQVLMDDRELRELQVIARSENMTTSEWVRQTLRCARRTKPIEQVERKLNAVRSAYAHEFPTADIDQMLAEIELGYRSIP